MCRNIWCSAERLQVKINYSEQIYEKTCHQVEQLALGCVCNWTTMELFTDNTSYQDQFIVDFGLFMRLFVNMTSFIR